MTKQYILQEVKESDFSVLNHADVQHYANELNMTPNQVREINMKEQGTKTIDYLETFIDSETDDIFDFY